MDDEKRINSVLAYQRKQLSEIKLPDLSGVEERIAASEQLLTELGYSLPETSSAHTRWVTDSQPIIMPSWEELYREAEDAVGADITLESLFTEDELQENRLAVKRLNDEYDQIHRLDKTDVAIAAVAGLLAGVVDILLVGIPQKTADGLKAGPLSNYVRDYFDRKYPPEVMKKLAQSSVSHVPFDAQDNRYTTVNVEGLSAYYHRLLSLGHDPILGFIFGVADILRGRMTTIDKAGNIVSQVMEVYADRRESKVFEAIIKECFHLKSDVTTSMGLPVPLMSLSNLLQFGSIGEESQTIAEIVQGMYYDGYDFIHFCSMPVSTMLVEVVVRIGYAIKRIKEGASIKDAIPFSANREKKPKLATMLFIGHSAASAINAGKVYFTKNPTAINYVQWLAFAKYSFQQLKWALLTKPELRDRYVRDVIDGELQAVYEDIDALFGDLQIGGVVFLPAPEGASGMECAR